VRRRHGRRPLGWEEEDRAVAEELKGRGVDPEEVREAARLTDSVRRSAEGWSSAEKIRKRREARR
jgi:hypothetical protein